MQTINIIGMYLVYSVILLIGLNGKTISKLSLLIMLSLGLFFLVPLSDINNTMQIIPNILFGFTICGILALLINVFTKSKEANFKSIKILSVEQKFYQPKTNVIDSLLTLSGCWFILYMAANIIAPLFENLSNMTNSMANHMSELANTPGIMKAHDFSYKHFYFIHLSVLAGIFFIGISLYFIKIKYFPSFDKAQLDPFINLTKEKTRKSVIKEIPLNQMKKIISSSKFVLIRNSTYLISQEEEVIAKINEIHPIIFTSVMVDRTFKNIELFGAAYENNTLRFYKIDRKYDSPPNLPNTTKVVKNTKADGVLTNV